MAARGFVSKLIPLVSARFRGSAPGGAARTPVRAFMCSAIRSQLHSVEGTGGVLTGKVDRFGGVTVNLADVRLPADISEKSLVQWRAEGKVAVWLRVPISLSRCAAAASTHGFTFHHASHDHAILSLWLGDGESRLPGFATHQDCECGERERQQTELLLLLLLLEPELLQSS
ncbi:hypothetical protein INR49_031478 [Caranx melampygus]|nr:hypothetical protein INR49_031478 [Caranx melampygus]